MRGVWLCLLVALMLVPLAVADHKERRGRLIDLDFDDDEDERKQEREEERKEREEEREEERKGQEEAAKREREEAERDAERDREAQRRAQEAGVGAQACVQPSGGATKQGNVVSWSAQSEPVEVHRRAGGDWQVVHTAAPGQELFVDKDLSKGRAYEYRVAFEGAAIGGCPTLEMTAVPSMPVLAGLGVAGIAAFFVGRR